MECKFCGRPTEIVLDDIAICEECYENAGSCCLEFGSADLWQTKEPGSLVERKGPESLIESDQQ